MNNAIQTQLIPVTELAPGTVARIRNEVIDKVVALASAELNRPPEDFVVRDIRPQDDLDWLSTTNVVTGAITTETWIGTSDDSEVYGQFKGAITAASLVMAANRWIAIYGVKDMRAALATIIEPALSMLKFEVGGNDRAIWDLMNMYAYPNAMAAVSPSAIIIPQNTSFQIYVYGGLSDDGGSTDIAQYIVLEGVVVEPKGKVLSP